MVGVGGPQFLDVVAPAGDPDGNRAHTLGGGDVERRVTHDENLAQIERAAEQLLSALERCTRERDAILGVRAVAAEEKEVVELPAPKLGVGRRFQPARRQPQRDAVLGQLLEQLRTPSSTR